ncbi:hypothetical protein BaRGS_00019577 [Batillaria attramentaria]|uniref:Uncharacterized protein n=1 Tax=Batillaria attramentaria TaxID=370345 RepID=A0ABD0KPZ7_9CAEN
MPPEQPHRKQHRVGGTCEVGCVYVRQVRSIAVQVWSKRRRPLRSAMADHQTQNLPPIWQKPLDHAIHLRVYRNGDDKFAGKGRYTQQMSTENI